MELLTGILGFLQANWIILVFFTVLWFMSLVTQSAFHHRYAAHKQFSMSTRVETVFFMWTWMAQGPSYLSVWAYGIMHRKHHDKADTPEDVHSPKYQNLFAMMWRTKKIFSAIFRKKDMETIRTYGKDVPEWRTFEKFAQSWPNRIFWGGLYLLFFYNFIVSPYLWVLLPLSWVLGPVHGAIINYGAHKFGYVLHKRNDTSKNAPFVGMCGEQNHNSHHQFPGRIRFAELWFEFDLTHRVLQALRYFKLIQFN